MEKQFSLFFLKDFHKKRDGEEKNKITKFKKQLSTAQLSKLSIIRFRSEN